MNPINLPTNPTDIETLASHANPTDPCRSRNIIARDNVRVELDDLAVQIAADRLTADALGQQIELFGIEDQPARVERRDGSLAGNHIIVNQARPNRPCRRPGIDHLL